MMSKTNKHFGYSREYVCRQIEDECCTPNPGDQPGNWCRGGIVAGGGL